MTALDQTITIGEPVADIPLTVRQGSSTLWETVAATCRTHPNLWIPITIPGIKSRRGFQNVTTLITRRGIKAFREGTWAAGREGDTIYVQYVTDADGTDTDADGTDTDDTEPAQQTITLNADVLSALRTLASLITEARP